MVKVPKKVFVPSSTDKQFLLWAIGTRLKCEYLDGVYEITEYAWNKKGNFDCLSGKKGTVCWCYRIRPIKGDGQKHLVITDNLADFAVNNYY